MPSLDESESEEEAQQALKSAKTRLIVKALKSARENRDSGFDRNVPEFIIRYQDEKLENISAAFLFTQCAFEGLLELEAVYLSEGKLPQDRFPLEDYLDLIGQLRFYAHKCKRCRNEPTGCAVS